MKHIPAHRFRELSDLSSRLRVWGMTTEEENHTEECDYCMEGYLLGIDPDEDDKASAERHGEPTPQPRRPKDD